MSVFRSPPPPKFQMHETQYLSLLLMFLFSLVFPCSNLLIERTHPLFLFALHLCKEIGSGQKLYKRISEENCKIYKSLTLDIVLKLRICLKFENYFAKGCWKLLSACRDYPLWSRYLINSVRWQAPGLAGSFCFSSQTSRNSDKSKIWNNLITNDNISNRDIR